MIKQAMGPLAWALALGPALAAPLEPARTGQETAYAAGDDGDLQRGRIWPQPRFINNGDGTLSDRLTGLMWLRDAACADNAGFAANAETSDWHRAMEFPARLNEAALEGHRCAGYRAAHDDWRLPNVVELSSLVRPGGGNNLEWLSRFGNADFASTGHIMGPAWTATTAAWDATLVWAVDLRSGAVAPVPKLQPGVPRPIFSAVRTEDPLPAIRASGQRQGFAPGDDGSVKPGRPWPDPRFVVAESGAAVIDKLTGLMWPVDSRCAVDRPVDWAAALDAVNALNGACGGHSGWRLPNVNELRSLIDYGQSSPALPAGHPFQWVGATPLWSATAGTSPADTAWAVDLNRGSADPAVARDQPLLAWPVRGPVSFPDIAIAVSEPVEPTALGGDGGLTVELANGGAPDAQLEIQALTLEGSSAFSLDGENCTGRLLAGEAACQVQVAFAPAQAGRHEARLLVRSNALGREATAVALAAQATVPANQGDDGGACFVATAAYGDYWHPHVASLRQFRDRHLLPHTWGRALVRAYYRYSPPAADYLRDHPAARPWARALLAPVILAVTQPLWTCAALLALGALSWWMRTSGRP